MGGLRLVSAGESHGFSLISVIDGIPAGLAVDPETINEQLSRLHSSYNLADETSIHLEDDEVAILSGVRSGETLGIPITLQIENRHAGLAQTVLLHTYEKRVMGAWSTPRPGHADLAGAIKFGYRDLRYVDERAGARETAIRVAAGAIARRLLLHFNIRIFSHVITIGRESVTNLPNDYEEIRQFAEVSSIRCADSEAANRMILALEAARREGETLGGVFEVIAVGIPIGLGGYGQWDERLESLIAAALMSFPGIRGVEIGDGFRSVNQSSYDAHDPLYVKRSKDKKQPDIIYRSTNHAGGIENGISNGSPISIRCAIPPVPSPMKPLPSVNLQTLRPDQPPQTFGEICTVLQLGVVAEAMLAIVIADQFLRKFGGDSLDEVKDNYSSHLERMPFQILPHPPEDDTDR